jgi:hypothetical protein
MGTQFQISFVFHLNQAQEISGKIHAEAHFPSGYKAMQPDESYLLQKYNGGARRDFQKL